LTETARCGIQGTRAKKFLSFHNPNLVVNADSEQVIVASCARRDAGQEGIRGIFLGIECGALAAFIVDDRYAPKIHVALLLRA